MKHIFVKRIVTVDFWVNDYGDILKNRKQEQDEVLYEASSNNFNVKEYDTVKIGNDYASIQEIIPDITNNTLIYRTDLVEYVEDEESKSLAEAKAKEVIEKRQSKKRWWSKFFQ